MSGFCSDSTDNNSVETKKLVILDGKHPWSTTSEVTTILLMMLALIYKLLFSMPLLSYLIKTTGLVKIEYCNSIITTKMFLRHLIHLELHMRVFYQLLKFCLRWTQVKLKTPTNGI